MGAFVYFNVAPRTEQMLSLFACVAAAALLNASVDIFDYIGNVPTYSPDACARVAANAVNYSCLSVELTRPYCSLYLNYSCMRSSPLVDCTAMFEGVRGNSCIPQYRTGGLPSCTAIKHPTCNTTPRLTPIASQPPLASSAWRPGSVVGWLLCLCAIGAFE
jgi:hypothetical protein